MPLAGRGAAVLGARTVCGLRTRVASSSPPTGPGVWSARVVWPCSSRTTMAVRGKRCSCSISCSARAKASAVSGRLAGSLAIDWVSSRSRLTGTSARPVLGTGLERIRGISA